MKKGSERHGKHMLKERRVRNKARQEHAAQKAESQRNDICTASPIPEISHNSDSPDEDVSDAPQNPHA